MSKPKTRRASQPRQLDLPTPDEYAAFVGQIELLDVWLIEAHIENRHGPRTPHQASVAVVGSDPTWSQSERAFDVQFPYKVQFTDGSSSYAEIAVVFGLHFTSVQPMTEGLFTVFKDINLPINTWPFLREFVSASLGRMGWQPFTLPTLKQGVAVEDESPEADLPPKKPRRPRTRGASVGGN